jgi:hypothetical protein
MYTMNQLTIIGFTGNDAALPLAAFKHPKNLGPAKRDGRSPVKCV